MFLCLSAAYIRLYTGESGFDKSLPSVAPYQQQQQQQVAQPQQQQQQGLDVLQQLLLLQALAAIPVCLHTPMHTNIYVHAQQQQGLDVLQQLLLLAANTGMHTHTYAHQQQGLDVQQQLLLLQALAALPICAHMHIQLYMGNRTKLSERTISIHIILFMKNINPYHFKWVLMHHTEAAAVISTIFAHTSFEKINTQRGLFIEFE